MSKRDMAYELDLFERMQNAKVNGTPLVDFHIAGDAALWQRFHQSVFDNDVKRFAKTRVYKKFDEEVRQFKKNHLSALLLFLFLFLLTKLSVIHLLLFRQKVLVYSVDKTSDPKTKSDFRLHGVYKTLIKTPVSFVECFHTTVDKRLVSNFFKRRRLALYLEAFDGVWYVYRFFKNLFVRPKTYDIEGIVGTEDEIQFVKTTIKKYLAVTDLLAFRTRVLRTVLRFSNVKAIVGIDDVRHYQELMEAGRQLNISTIVVQHGHFTQYHLGWLGGAAYKKARYQKASKILVWSRYWKEELDRLGSVYRENEIVVSGYPTKRKEAPFLPSTQEITVLVPHETEAPKEEVAQYLRALASCDNVSVFFKVRPDVPVHIQLSEYPEDISPYVTVTGDLSEIPEPDAVVGVYSTFLYDMTLLGIPAFLMETSMDYGKRMVINGLAQSLPLKNICTALPRAVDESTQAMKERLQRLDSKEDFRKVFYQELVSAGVV